MNSNSPENFGHSKGTIWGMVAAAANVNKLAEEGYKPISLVADDLPPGKVPLHRAGNLKKLQKARDGVSMGVLKIEQFEDTVYEVLEVATVAIGTFELPAVKSVETTLDDEEAEVFAECRSALRVLLASLLEMLEYVEHRDRGQLDLAMEHVEEAMERVAHAQDMALEKAKKSLGPPVA